MLYNIVLACAFFVVFGVTRLFQTRSLSRPQVCDRVLSTVVTAEVRAPEPTHFVGETLCPLRKAFKGNNQHFILFFKKDKTTRSLKREWFGVCYPGCSAVLAPLPPAQAEKHPSWFCPVPLMAPDPCHHPVHATGVLTGLSTRCFMKTVASPLIQSKASEYLGRPECAHGSSPLGPAVPLSQ